MGENKMNKITQKEAEKLANEIKKKYGKDLHLIMLIYKSEDGKQFKMTRNLETDTPDIVISYLERQKILLINAVNKGLEKKIKLKKKKK